MSLHHQDIDDRVRTITTAFLQGIKVRPGDEPVVKAGMELLINLLQNINDIAYCAREAEDRAAR